MADTCGAIAFSCHCSLARDHEGPHHCTANSCGGMWEGDARDESFKTVRLPVGSGSLAPIGSMFNALLGFDDDDDEEELP